MGAGIQLHMVQLLPGNDGKLRAVSAMQRNDERGKPGGTPPDPNKRRRVKQEAKQKTPLPDRGAVVRDPVCDKSSEGNPVSPSSNRRAHPLRCLPPTRIQAKTRFLGVWRLVWFNRDAEGMGGRLRRCAKTAHFRCLTNSTIPRWQRGKGKAALRSDFPASHACIPPALWIANACAAICIRVLDCWPGTSRGPLWMQNDAAKPPDYRYAALRTASLSRLAHATTVKWF
jgi:hypothetical protein